MRSLIAQLDGTQRYELRIALNAFDILEREAAGADAATDAERARLSALLGRHDTLAALRAELCARLRDGRQAPDDPALLATLRAGVLARLAFDQPDFKPLPHSGDRP
nr:DUF6285 domain-containing protein [Solimonas terrae]